jgi:hypothetical protein
MNFSSYPNQFHQTETLGFSFSASVDMPSFDEAFNTDNLRKFYQQQNFCHAKSLDDQFFEDSSPSSPDDRETQASPLVRYINRYSQGNSSPEFAINLNQRFFSDESDSMFQSPTQSLQDLSKDSYPITNTKSFDDVAQRQPKVVEMKGNVKMTMSFGNIAVHQEPRMHQSMGQIFSEEFDEETRRITKLIRSKKVFKIQKDIKPKVSPKKTASPKQKGKTAAPQAQPINLTPTVFPVQRENSLNSLNQNGVCPQLPFSQPHVMNFLQNMKQQGFSHEQIMNHVHTMTHRPNVNLQPASLKQL